MKDSLLYGENRLTIVHPCCRNVGDSQGSLNVNLDVIINVIIERDSQIAIQSVTGKTKARNQITNLIEDIITIVKAVRNIQFSYCIRMTNKLADTITKKAQACTSQNVVLGH